MNEPSEAPNKPKTPSLLSMEIRLGVGGGGGAFNPHPPPTHPPCGVRLVAAAPLAQKSHQRGGDTPDCSGCPEEAGGRNQKRVPVSSRCCFARRNFFTRPSPPASLATAVTWTTVGRGSPCWSLPPLDDSTGWRMTLCKWRSSTRKPWGPFPAPDDCLFRRTAEGVLFVLGQGCPLLLVEWSCRPSTLQPLAWRRSSEPRSQRSAAKGLRNNGFGFRGSWTSLCQCLHVQDPRFLGFQNNCLPP